MRSYYLHQMGITPWVLRTKNAQITGLAQLQASVAACERCPLHAGRTQTVFARGHISARLMIVGEAPDFNEDKEGVPFVGNAGSLLNKMIASVGLAEEEVYISNVIKCRPPNDRSPDVLEVSQCGSFLKEQINLIQPTVILAVGITSGQFLLNTTASIADMRNKIHDYQGTPLIVSHHPAYLLRNPLDKKLAYQDWLQVKHLFLN